MKRRVRISMGAMGVAAMVFGAGVVSPAAAQAPATAQPSGRNLEMTAPAPETEAPRPGLGLERTMPLEERAIREQQFYPGLVRSTHEPAFVTPFVTTIPVSRTEGVRVGLSGWTAPAVPFDIPQATGGVAFGLTFAWWSPVPARAAPEPAPANDR